MNSMPHPSAPELNATVMASAGTGKTWLLVTRLVRLLLEGAAPDGILAITFTRKAAAEMQKRLAERLFQLASLPDRELDERLREIQVTPDAGSRDQARRLYERLLRSKHTVRTTTFHAFCQEILRRFPLEADVPPGFELLERTGEIERGAWDALVTEATASPDGAVGHDLQTLLAYTRSASGVRSALGGFISHRSDWWAYTEGVDDPVETAKARLRQQLAIDPGVDPVAGFFGAARGPQLQRFSQLLGAHPTQTNLKDIQRLETALAEDLDARERFDACRQVFLTQKDEPRSRKASRAQETKMGHDGQEEFLALHEAVSKALVSTLGAIAARASWHAHSAWYRCGSRLLEHLQRIKQEQRLLDFADLEWKAYRLLGNGDNAQWVQYKLDQRIDHLLVDEFQDTNPTQWRLLLPLLQEMAAGAGAGRRRSVFLVGDAKQSIYRFRRADHRLFAAAGEWLGQHMDARAHSLDTSWRSAPIIMECVNRVFEHASMKPLMPDFPRHDTHHRELWGQVSLLPLIKSQEEAPDAPQERMRNPLESPRHLPRDDRHYREGLLIAEKISALVKGGVVVESGGKARRTGYGDIILLIRSRTHVRDYERALREAGIPYLGTDRGTLLESLEVRDMVALLGTLITPFDNLSLAAVLRSPLFACSDQDLMLLARQGKGNWLEHLGTLAVAVPGSTLAHAFRRLSDWRAVAGKLPIHDLLDRIYSEGNVLARYEAAYPEHLRSRAGANLTRFIELALEIDSGRYPSLTHFLAKLREMRENTQEAPDEAPAGSGKRVRLMTIHGAKGLEAPVVFLADAANAGDKDGAYRVITDWPAGASRPQGILLAGRKEQRDPLTLRQLERERLEEARESANLLYVALTRARQLLFVSGTSPSRGDELGWYGLLRQALDPLGECPDGEEITRMCGHMPEAATEPGAALARETAKAHPMLSRVLQVAPSMREIAPSRSVAGPASAGESGDEDALLRGIAIHQLLERLMAHPELPFEIHARSVADGLGIPRDDGELRDWQREVRDLLACASLSQVFARENAGYCEIPIQYESGDRIVHGVIDRVVVFPEEIWVVDYKTHRGACAANIPGLAARYREQLRLYAEAAARLWRGRRVRPFLLFTAGRELHELETASEC